MYQLLKPALRVLAAIIGAGAITLVVAIWIITQRLSDQPALAEPWLGAAIDRPVRIGALRLSWYDGEPVLVGRQVQIGHAIDNQELRLNRVIMRLNLRQSLKTRSVRMASIEIDSPSFKIAVAHSSAAIPDPRSWLRALAQFTAVLAAQSTITVRLNDAQISIIEEPDGKPILLSHLNLALEQHNSKLRVSVDIPDILQSSLYLMPDGRVDLQGSINRLPPSISESLGGDLSVKSFAFKLQSELFVNGADVSATDASAHYDLIAKQAGWRAPVTNSTENKSAGVGPGVTIFELAEIRAQGRLYDHAAAWSLTADPLELVNGQAEMANIRTALEIRQMSNSAADTRAVLTIGTLQATPLQALAEPVIEAYWPGLLHGFAPIALSTDDPSAIHEHHGARLNASAVSEADGGQSYDQLPRLSGEIRGSELVLETTATGIRVESFRTELSRLSLDASQFGIGFDQVHARLSYALSAFHAGIGGGTLQLPGADKPISIELVGGSLSHQIGSNIPTLDLEAIDLVRDNEQVVLSAQLALAPHLSLGQRLRSANGRARLELQSVAEVIAGLNLDPALKKWSARALGQGSAELAFNLGTDDQGQLLPELTAHVKGALLRYGREWPPIEDLDTLVTIRGTQLDATSEAGTVSGATLQHTTLRISDITLPHPVVNVLGSVQGDTRHVLNFIRDAPFARHFASVLKNAAFSGPARVKLKLDIPLGNGRSRVDGRLLLTDNRATLAALQKGPEDLSGEVQFNRDGIEGFTLNGIYLGRPIKVVSGPPQAAATTLTLSTRITDEMLGTHLRNAGVSEQGLSDLQPLLRHLHGQSDAQLLLALPHLSSGRAGQLDLELHSSMQGFQLTLPAPLAKSAEQARPLNIRTSFGAASSQVLEVSYAEHMGATLLMQSHSQGTGLSGISAWFSNDARSDVSAGTIRVNGKTELLDLDGWLTQQSTGPTPILALNVDIEADKLIMLNTVLEQARLRVNRPAKQPLTATLQSNISSGRILYTLNEERPTLQARFSRLHLAKASPTAAPAVDSGAVKKQTETRPQRLPALDVRIEALTLGELDLGEAELQTVPKPRGLSIDRLIIKAPQFDLRAGGEWLDGDPQTTRGNIHVRSPDLGRLLRSLGYDAGGETDGGELITSLAAQWPGAPWQLNLGQTTGSMDLEVKDGRLTNVDRGAAGRLFGVLQLASLPRRLTLDFRDLFEKGLRYKRMHGRFDITQGSAFTEDFEIDTAIATIRILGRTGLASQDYNQYMSIVPKLSSSLPLAPIWLAEKVLNRKILDGAFERNYRITGSWDDPIIKPVVDVASESKTIDEGK